VATYAVSTTARQDAVLATLAAKRGITVAALMDGEMQRILRRAQNEVDQDEATSVASAYTSATNAKQAQVRTVLGL
jgi:hypothetical protein